MSPIAPGFLTLHADAELVLTQWEPPNEGQSRLRDEYLTFLAQHQDAMSRDCAIGHLTASALVLDESRQHVLLTLHPRIGRWVQMGGHCEAADPSLRDAALREAVEESGIRELVITEQPVQLDRHRLTCSGGPTEHLDVRYLALAPDGALPVMSHESDDLRWFSLHALPTGLDASVLTLLDVAARS